MLIAGLEASASGREALAARLAHRPNWTARYFLADRRSDTATLAHKSAVALKVAAAGARIATYDDHRMAMAFAVAGLRMPGVVIQDPGCTAKTYPDYFTDLAAAVGGRWAGG